MKCPQCHSGTIIEPDSYESEVNYGVCDSCDATFPHPDDRCSICGEDYRDCPCVEEWEEELRRQDEEEMFLRAKPGTCPECGSTDIEAVRTHEIVGEQGLYECSEMLCACGFFWDDTRLTKEK